MDHMEIGQLIDKLIDQTKSDKVLWKKSSMIDTDLGVPEKTLYIHNFEGHEFRIEEINEFKQYHTIHLVLKLVVKGGTTTILNKKEEFQEKLTILKNLAYRQNPNPEDVISNFLKRE